MPRKITPRKLPSQDRARATVDALLQAANEVLQAEGAENLTTNKIAERAGVSIGTLYQYFPNKESLLIGMIESHLDAIRVAIRTELEQHDRLPLPEMVERVIRSMLAVYWANLPLALNLDKVCLSLGGKTSLEVLLEELRVWTRKVLEERAVELVVKDAELGAFVVVHSVEGVLLGAVRARPELFEGDVLVPQLTAMVVGYLAPDRVAELGAPRKLVSAG